MYPSRQFEVSKQYFNTVCVHPVTHSLYTSASKHYCATPSTVWRVCIQKGVTSNIDITGIEFPIARQRAKE